MTRYSRGIQTCENLGLWSPYECILQTMFQGGVGVQVEDFQTSFLEARNKQQFQLCYEVTIFLLNLY
jgi:hypothetical protein